MQRNVDIDTSTVLLLIVFGFSCPFLIMNQSGCDLKMVSKKSGSKIRIESFY
jgi:hypothetical protein